MSLRRTLVWEVTRCLSFVVSSLIPLVEIIKGNFSHCPYPLAHTSRGGCFLPCSAIKWLNHPTIRAVEPELSYVRILIDLIAGILFTFVWIALRNTQ